MLTDAIPLWGWLVLGIISRSVIIITIVWMMKELWDPNAGEPWDRALNLTIRTGAVSLVIMCLFGIAHALKSLILEPYIVVQGSEQLLIFSFAVLLVWVFFSHLPIAVKKRDERLAHK